MTTPAGIDVSSITIADKIKELKRELAQRARVYRRLVSYGTLTQPQADWQIAVMTAILHEYEKMAQAEAAKDRLL